MRLRLKATLKFSALSIFLFVHSEVKAVSISGGLGFGNTQMENETKDSEGPLTQAFTVEKLFHSRLSLGVEHLRSLQTNLVTSASFSGLLARYYINAAPEPFVPAGRIDPEDLRILDLSVFVGLGMGLAQSSRLPNGTGLSSNAAGFYLSPRAGVEYQLNESMGVRAELTVGSLLVGTGSLSQVSMGGAFIYNLED